MTFFLVFEELEGVDETPVEHSTFGDIMTTGIEGKEIMDIDSNKEEEEIIQADKIIDDVSIINEDFFDINHFLGINFRMENNFTLTDSTSVLKDSWFVVKLKSFLRNIQEMILSSIYKIASKYKLIVSYFHIQTPYNAKFPILNTAMET